jgi:NADH-quinone oxidoreductase subunit C
MSTGTDNRLSLVVKTLTERLQAQMSDFRGQTSLTIQPELVQDAGMILRDEFNFNLLMDITAVDYLKVEPRFHVVYQFLAIEDNLRLTLRVPVAGRDAHLATLTGIYPGANWYEREVADMFGIRFDGHPDPRRILMPADWQGHPLRKDYPLGYEEVEFSFNFAEIEAHKPKGKEM